MVPFSDTALSFIFRLIHVNVPIDHTRHAERRADSFTGADTAWLIKCVYDMISKIRARLSTRLRAGLQLYQRLLQVYLNGAAGREVSPRFVRIVGHLTLPPAAPTFTF